MAFVFDCEGDTLRALVTSSVCVEKQESNTTVFDKLKLKTKVSFCLFQRKTVHVAPEAYLSSEQHRIQSEEVSYLTVYNSLNIILITVSVDPQCCKHCSILTKALVDVENFLIDTLCGCLLYCATLQE